MPSGSRGGSRGSHGGSRGGRSSGGSRGGHGHGGATFIVRHPSRHTIRLRSRPGYPDRYFDFSALHSVIFTIFAIIIFISGMTSCSSSDNIAFLKEDYNYYQAMIATAEANPDDYIVDATVTGKYYHSDFDKYYITYEMTYTTQVWLPSYGFVEEVEVLEGYSFSVYDSEEILSFYSGQTISVAIDTAGVKSYTDSIPMDYKDMPIEKDGEYLDALSQQNTSKVALIVTITILVLWCVIYIIVSKKLEKNYEKSHPVNSSVIKTNQEDDFYCDYCGTYFGKNAIGKCKNCGATKK